MPYIVYCVIFEDEASALDELEGPGLQVIQYGDMAAIVEPTDRMKVRESRKNLMRHQLLIEQVLQRCTAIVPMRFGTVVNADDDISTTLFGSHETWLRQSLNAIRYKHEYVVKLIWEQEMLLKLVYLEHPELSQQAQTADDINARIAIGRAVQEQIEIIHDQMRTGLVDSVKPHIFDVAYNTVADDQTSVDASFLIHQDQVEAFENALASFSKSIGYDHRIKLIGPNAPYSFVNVNEMRS